MQYVELCLGDFTKRNRVVPLDTLGRHAEAARRNRTPMFRSLFSFDDSLNQYLRMHKGSVAGFNGVAYLDAILIDIDKGEYSDEDTLQRARDIVAQLQDLTGIVTQNIRPAFSGRGYHIVIPNIFGLKPSVDLPALLAIQLKAMLPGIDDIYDKTRLIRVTNTLNEKSGLYKIPLTPEELFTLKVEQIQELAKQPRLDFRYPPFVETEYKAIETPVEQAQPVPETKSEGVAEKESPAPEEKSEVVITAQPAAIVSCVQNMFNKGAQPGNRHQTMLRIASAWRRAGIPRIAIVESLVAWATPSGMERKEVEKIVNNVFDKRYEYSCYDEMFAKHCESTCIHFKAKNYAPRAESARSLEKKYVNFVRNDYSKVGLNLRNYYRMPSDFWMYPEELVIVTGDTGLGKTAWVQNLIAKTKHLRVLVFSLEVGTNLFYRRQIQVAHEMPKHAVDTHYMRERNHLSDAIAHIEVIGTSPELRNLKRIIADVRPQVVVIDTIDQVVIEGITDETAHTRHVAFGLKNLAIETKTIVIGVHHPSKSGVQDQEGERRSLNVHALKGSSSIEQKADKVIAIEGDRFEIQEGMDDQVRIQVPQARTVRSLKSRDEDPFLFYAKFVPDHFTFKQVGVKEWKFLQAEFSRLKQQATQMAGTPSENS